MAENASTAEIHFSAPPPDVIQPVQVVETLSVDQTRAKSLGGNGVRFSEPPPDIIQPVQVVETTSSTAGALSVEAATDKLPLSLKEADSSEEIGGAADPEAAPEPEARAALTNEEIYRIIREVAVVDSGDDLYSAISADREFETPGHPAHRRRHFGLAFGLALFTQESGRLGRVLQLMHRRDSVTFAEVFGPDAETLLRVTNAATPEERLQPVGGDVVWSPKWIERFKLAGTIPTFQAAQNEEAIEGQFRPVLRIAAGLGLTSDRGLAMIYDRVVSRGLGGGARWVVQAVGPLRTAAQRSHALQMLGYQSVAEFQAAAGIGPDDVFTPETHAAMVDTLRRQGETPLPTAGELVCRLVAAATGRARQRLLRLRDSTALLDTVYDLG
jgi:hypothetical protein